MDPNPSQTPEALETASVPVLAHPKKAAFLAAFRELGNIRYAAERAGVGRRTVTYWRNSDSTFQAAFRVAMEDAADSLEKEARRRAEHGVRKLVTYKGELVKVPSDPSKPVGEGNPLVPLVEHEYSDTLTIFLLKALRPGKYRETHRFEHTGKGGGPIKSEVREGKLDLSLLDDAELETMRALRAKASQPSSN